MHMCDRAQAHKFCTNEWHQDYFFVPPFVDKTVGRNEQEEDHIDRESFEVMWTPERIEKFVQSRVHHRHRGRLQGADAERR